MCVIETLKVTSRPRGEFTGRSTLACKCRAGGPAWRCNGVSEPLADCFGGSRCHFIQPASLCPPRLSFSGRFFLLLHVCSLSSLLPGRNTVACRPSRWRRVLRPAFLSAKRLLRPVQVGGVSTQPAMWVQGPRQRPW